MPLGAENFYPLIPRAGFDHEFLNTVRAAFRSSGYILSWWETLLILAGLAALIALLYLMARSVRPKPVVAVGFRVATIEAPGEVREIIERAINMRAVCDVEVYDEDYQEIYKCTPLGFNEEGDLELELGAFRDVTLDFVNKDVRVAFRLSRRGKKEEYYQFETRSRYYDSTELRGLREKSIRLVPPVRMTRGQKRRYVRVRPSEEHAFGASILWPQRGANPLRPSLFEVQHEAEVVDLSFGGMKLRVESPPSQLRFERQDTIYLHFELPQEDLGLEGIPGEFYVRAKVTDIDEVEPGQQMVRVMWVERGRLDPQTNHLTFRAASGMAFEDLFRWIQAYQRHRIQVQRDTRPRPSEVENQYPRQPLKVKPKYPPASWRPGAEEERRG